MRTILRFLRMLCQTMAYLQKYLSPNSSRLGIKIWRIAYQVSLTIYTKSLSNENYISCTATRQCVRNVEATTAQSHYICSRMGSVVEAMLCRSKFPFAENVNSIVIGLQCCGISSGLNDFMQKTKMAHR